MCTQIVKKGLQPKRMRARPRFLARINLRHTKLSLYLSHLEKESGANMPKIKIYTTTYCPYCTLAKDWMKKHNLKFTEVNVENDPAAAKEMVRKTGQRGVPVIEIDGKFVVGFDKVALAKILGMKE